jgi:hypothetical protein
MALPPPMANNNQQMRSGWVNNDGRMRWRTAAAEETWRMEKQQRHCNGQANMVARGQQQHHRHQQQTITD